MKRSIIMLTAIAAAFLIATPAYAVVAKNGVVFNSIPKTLPGNVSSQAFQATQASEFGDGITFASSHKTHLKTVTVVMSSWACESGGNATCTTTPGATFTHPITLNLYAANVGNTPGSLIASVTKPFAIKYRPTSDPGGANCGGDDTAWYSATDSACYHGIAQTITFNFASLHLILPHSIVYGVAYNTSGFGNAPYGYSTQCAMDGNCAYDSLNVGAAAGIPARGTDRYLSGVFYDSATPGNYCDGGTAGSGFFRLDDGCWAGFNPLVRFLFQK